MSKFVILGFLFFSAMVSAGESRLSSEDQKALYQNNMGLSKITKVYAKTPDVYQKTGLASGIRLKLKNLGQAKPFLLNFFINNTKLLALKPDFVPKRVYDCHKKQSKAENATVCVTKKRPVLNLSDKWQFSIK